MKFLIDSSFLLALIFLCWMVFSRNPTTKRTVLIWFSLAVLVGVCFVEGLIDTTLVHRNFYHDPAFQVHLFIFVIPFTVCLLLLLSHFIKKFRTFVALGSQRYQMIEVLMTLLYIGVLITGQGLLNKF